MSLRGPPSPLASFLKSVQRHIGGSMKRKAVVIAATLTIIWNVPLGSMDMEAREVRIRILDYAKIADEVIAQAQQRVADIYKIIGVQIRWQVPFRPLEESASVANTLTERSDFVIIVLSPEMSRHLKIAPDALGMAIVSPPGGGRIAYVLFHRVRLAARDARSSATDVLGMVIAHELGHLMLPDGAHSNKGLMRAKWNITELRRPRRPAFDFTNPQAEAIRGRDRRELP